MAYVLGSTTLPNPKKMQRRILEQSTFHEAINGASKKDISSRKEQFILQFTRLSQATVASILAEFNLFQSLDFSISDGELEVTATPVHVDIPGRDYNTKGSEYREDVEIVLTEVE